MPSGYFTDCTGCLPSKEDGGDHVQRLAHCHISPSQPPHCLETAWEEGGGRTIQISRGQASHRRSPDLFGFKIYCFVSKRGRLRSNSTGVENRSRISDFFAPCKIRVGWTKCLGPNLCYTFNGGASQSGRLNKKLSYRRERAHQTIALS